MKECGCGKLFVICNRDWNTGRLIEIFIIMGKTGGCEAAQSEAIARTVSRSLRYGVPISEIRKDLRGIKCGKQFGFGPNKVQSCADAVGQIIEEELAWETTDGFKEWLENEREMRQKHPYGEREEGTDSDGSGTGAGEEVRP